MLLKYMCLTYTNFLSKQGVNVKEIFVEVQFEPSLG